MDEVSTLNVFTVGEGGWRQGAGGGDSSSMMLSSSPLSSFFLNIYYVVSFVCINVGLTVI